MAEIAPHIVFLFQRVGLRLLTVGRKFPIIGEGELQSASTSQEVPYVTFITKLTKASYMAKPIFQGWGNRFHFPMEEQGCTVKWNIYKNKRDYGPHFVNNLHVQSKLS